MLGLIIAYPLLLLLAHCSQYLLHGTLRPLRRGWQLWLLQTATTTAIYLLALALSLRPYLAAVSTLILLSILLVINQAKYRALREPLVFSDAYLYMQVVKHPRLFLPFLNIPLVVSSILVGLCLLYLAVQVEASIVTTTATDLLPFLSMVIVIAGLCVCLALMLSEKFTLSFSATQDVRALGFYNSLVIYTLQAHDKKRRAQFQQKLIAKSPFHAQRSLSATSSKAQKNPERSGDIIVIQSESFFDPRPMCPAINTDVLQHFDNMCNEAVAQGSLNVPAWGANTLRTEFAFLTGIANHELEHYRFNPYQYINDPVPTLASHLKTKGYRCIAIHPNNAGFFRRNDVFPLLGFDEFIDINEFDKQDIDGPYISDAAVSRKIDETLGEHDDIQPLFLFVITMENHGPLHLESLEPKDTEHFYQGQQPNQHHDLSVYLRHLCNADTMLEEQINSLKNRKPATILSFYGDHVPSMPDLYDQLNFTQTQTKYLVWPSKK